MDPLTLFQREGVPRADLLARLVRPCVILHPSRLSGRTRLGGVPELAEGRPWPRTSTGAAMLFVGQLELSNLRGTPVASALPEHGLLGFFCSCDAGRPEFAITWSEEGRAKRTEPADGSTVLPEHGATLRPWWSIPPAGGECPFTARVLRTDEERNAWRDLEAEWREDERDLRGHRLLGYATCSDAYLSAALDTNDELRERFFARPVNERAQDPYVDEGVLARARAFRLLLELADSEELGVTWGDGAPTALLVHESVWTNQDFDLTTQSLEAAAFCLRT